MPQSSTALSTLVTDCLRTTGQSQADLARKMGVTESTLSSLMYRKPTRLPAKTISRLAQALGVHTAKVVEAYLIDAGERVETIALDGPEEAIVVGAMQHMTPQRRATLAKIAQDLRDE